MRTAAPAAGAPGEVQELRRDRAARHAVGQQLHHILPAPLAPLHHPPWTAASWCGRAAPSSGARRAAPPPAQAVSPAPAHVGCGGPTLRGQALRGQVGGPHRGSQQRADGGDGLPGTHPARAPIVVPAAQQRHRCQRLQSHQGPYRCKSSSRYLYTPDASQPSSKAFKRLPDLVCRCASACARLQRCMKGIQRCGVDSGMCGVCGGEVWEEGEVGGGGGEGARTGMTPLGETPSSWARLEASQRFSTASCELCVCTCTTEQNTEDSHPQHGSAAS